MGAIWYYTALALTLTGCYQLMIKSQRVNKKLSTLLFYCLLAVLMNTALFLSAVDIVGLFEWE